MHTGTAAKILILALAAVASVAEADPTIAQRPQAAVTVAAAQQSDRPNVVLILTDDQRFDTMWAMPTVMADLAAHGISYTNGYVSNPLCCPSRASILTGRYSHSTGVYTNEGQGPYGGFSAFDDSSTVATWLDDAGYRTALFGKYFNGYTGPYVPPGWDRWFATYTDSGGAFYNFLATDDGQIRTYGSEPSDYGAVVLAREAVQFVGSTPLDTPLFLYFAPHAPHEPAIAAPGDGSAFAELSAWRPPSYDEVDVSDKPAYIRKLPRLDAGLRAEIDGFRRRQHRSLLAVDRAVGEIVGALEATGRLANTLIVFTSDNAMLWGEHRWDTKLVPYEESIHVPFVVRFDAMIRSPRTDDRLVLNIDLAPTFAELANVGTDGAEGASLVPLFEGTGGPWRLDFLLEHLKKTPRGVPTYCGVHSRRHVYVRYTTGEEELYDLGRDPAQLVNLVGLDRYADVRRDLIRRLRDLCDPVPPGYAW